MNLEQYTIHEERVERFGLDLRLFTPVAEGDGTALRSLRANVSAGRMTTGETWKAPFVEMNSAPGRVTLEYARAFVTAYQAAIAAAEAMEAEHPTGTPTQHPTA
jgi:hypothetical protein